MPKIAAYYFLLLYAASLCKPLTVWLADAMAHEAFPHQHLQGLHHSEGKNHVHYQMNKAAKDDAPEQKNTTSKTDDDVVISSFIENHFCTYTTITSKNYPCTVVLLPAVFLPLHSPPPKCKAADNIIG